MKLGYIISAIVILLGGSLFGDDHVTVLNGVMYRIDQEGNLWRQQSSFWVAVRHDGIFINTEKISASISDNRLIVLQQNVLHSVDPDTGAYTVLTRGLTYNPNSITGLCGIHGYAFLIYGDTLCRVKLDGSGGLEPLTPDTRWANCEGMASNLNSVIIVANGGWMYSLKEDGSSHAICPGSRPAWHGIQSIFPSSGETFIVTQRGVIHQVMDVTNSGYYRLITPF